MAKDIKKRKKTGSKKRKKTRVVIKKRFFVICIIIILAIAVGLFFGIKAIMGAFSSGGGAAGTTTSQNQNGTNEDGALEDGVQPAIMVDDPVTGEAGDEPGVTLTTEQNIRSAVLGSWYVSPLGQTRAGVERTFGTLTRGEDWADGVYYHKNFPDTMYVTYQGDKGDDGLPAAEAVCTSVNVALKLVIGYEQFTPDTTVWGNVNKDTGGNGWSDYYYSILIKNGINLIVYCNEDGVVDKETHILVKKV